MQSLTFSHQADGIATHILAINFTSDSAGSLQLLQGSADRAFIEADYLADAIGCDGVLYSQQSKQPKAS